MGEFSIYDATANVLILAIVLAIVLHGHGKR